VGTSATLSGPESREAMRSYAGQIFASSFEPATLIEEERLSPEEFFRDHTAFGEEGLRLLPLPGKEPAQLRRAPASLATRAVHKRLCICTDKVMMSASTRSMGFLAMAPALSPLSRDATTKPDAQLVADACSRAAEFLGLSRDEMAAVVGKHRTTIERSGLNPHTKAGELGLLLIRVYRSLHALYGGDKELMRHWLQQRHRHLGDQPPRQLLERVEGLTRVASYLDALRG